MQNKFIAIYCFIFAMLIIIMNLSQHTNHQMREQSVALFAPFWERILSFKHFLAYPTHPSPFTSLLPEEDKQRLQLENQLLATEISYLQKQLDEQLSLSSQISTTTSSSENPSVIAEYQKSLQRVLNKMHMRLNALPARVIFRSMDTWNNSVWINVGKSNNENHETTVAINSPVVIGNAIIGVIDYVGNRQSKVRLISDPRLNLSVRSARGGEQEAFLHQIVETLLQQLNRKKNFSLPSNDQTTLVNLLSQLKDGLQPFKKTWYLAKGELLGSTVPSRANQKITLKGTGFNYDFPDDEGDSRDLRNGKSLLHPQKAAIPILKNHDVLVTTGMDGIFPPGFQVAYVTQVSLLKEGDYYYDLEARPIASSLSELSLVFVLPPLKYESID